MYLGYDSLQMEQYAHLLIAADPDFVPDPAQVTAFFNLILNSFGFRLVVELPFEPGIIVLKPSDRVRKGTDPMTGEVITIPVRDRLVLRDSAEIFSSIHNLGEWTVGASGKWVLGKTPIELRVSDGKPFESECSCFMSCNQRPKPVCTGNWWGEFHGGMPEFTFGDPNSPIQSAGVFTQPWTGERVEVSEAGSARFWIEFEFGKWLLPKMTDGFDVLRPELVTAVQNCFGTRFVQAGRAVG
jgi:hypothetical protein